MSSSQSPGRRGSSSAKAQPASQAWGTAFSRAGLSGRTCYWKALCVLSPAAHLLVSSAFGASPAPFLPNEMAPATCLLEQRSSRMTDDAWAGRKLPGRLGGQFRYRRIQYISRLAGGYRGWLLPCVCLVLMPQTIVEPFRTRRNGAKESVAPLVFPPLHLTFGVRKYFFRGNVWQHRWPLPTQMPAVPHPRNVSQPKMPGDDPGLNVASGNGVSALKAKELSQPFEGPHSPGGNYSSC